jgi:predicted metal-dependent hydrolase
MSTPVSLIPQYLGGYPASLQAQALRMAEEGRLAAVIESRYPEAHTVRTDAALYAYVQDIKARGMRQSSPVSMVVYDTKLKVLSQALGTHTRISRVQGGKLKAKREIRIASLFKDAPADFLRMIVVHELAHLREAEHDKAFYSLCEHLAPDYHQLEFDTRLWLLQRALVGKPKPAAEG